MEELCHLLGMEQWQFICFVFAPIFIIVCVIYLARKKKIANNFIQEHGDVCYLIPRIINGTGELKVHSIDGEKAVSTRYKNKDAILITPGTHKIISNAVLDKQGSTISLQGNGLSSSWDYKNGQTEQEVTIEKGHDYFYIFDAETSTYAFQEMNAEMNNEGNGKQILKQKSFDEFEKKEVDCEALSKMLENDSLEGVYNNSFLKNLVKGYNKLQPHNVANLYYIKEVSYEDSIYVVYAMPMKADTLSEETVNAIKEAANGLSVGGIRYGSREISNSFGVHDFDADGNCTLSDLSEMDYFSNQIDGVILLAFMVMSKRKRKELECSAAAYGFGKPQLIGKNGLWIAPIQNKNL